MWLQALNYENLDKNVTCQILGFLFHKTIIMTVTTSPGHYIAGDDALSALNSKIHWLFIKLILNIRLCAGASAYREAGQAGQASVVVIINGKCDPSVHQQVLDST